MHTDTFTKRIRSALAMLVVFAMVALTSHTAAAQEDAAPEQIPLDALAAAFDSAGPGIVGGSNAKLADHPYYVWVTNERATLVCGGTLIRKRWVLTAAHCVDDMRNRDAYAVFGFNGDSAVDVVRSKKVVAHPKYNPVTVKNDIALIRLDRNPKLSSPLIKPAGIMTKKNRPKFGSKQLVVGLGKTSDNGGVANRLKKGTVKVRSCQGEFEHANNRTQICTTNRPTAVCSGDSGGPLMVGNKVAGIVSYGAASSCRDLYSVFTRVSHYKQWIKKTIRRG